MFYNGKNYVTQCVSDDRAKINFFQNIITKYSVCLRIISVSQDKSVIFFNVYYRGFGAEIIWAH